MPVGHYALQGGCRTAAYRSFTTNSIVPLIACPSAEAERQFLQQSRGLDESESIAISFLEMAQEERYGFLTSHRADGHLMVGQAARYRRDWDASLDHLSRTLDEFSGIAIENTADFHGLRTMELTHFLLGEVHMARFRVAGLAGDRANAADHFRRSIQIGSRLGSKGQSAKSRLQALVLA